MEKPQIIDRRWDIARELMDVEMTLRDTTEMVATLPRERHQEVMRALAELSGSLSEAIRFAQEAVKHEQGAWTLEAGSARTTSPHITDTPAIKPCPFCGSMETGLINVATGENQLRVVCRRCLTIGPLMDTEQLVTTDDAIHQWNRREAYE